LMSSSTLEDLSPLPGIYFSFLEANNIRHRVASNCRHLDRGTTQPFPLVLLLHGFPESWYSWRHQLLALRDEPYVVVAPDMRGYGETAQPTSVEDYTQPVLAKDVVEISRRLGYDKFIVVGHDWGAMVAWSVALLYPDQVMGVCGLSVPYAGTPKKGLLTMLEVAYGRCIDPSLPRHVLEEARFHYMLYNCLPKVEDEYRKNAKEFLYRIYGYRRGCQAEAGTPEYDPDGLLFPPTGDPKVDQTRALDAAGAPGWWKRIPRPLDLPRWITPLDLEIITAQYLDSGFRGALSWYRAADRNFELMKELLKPENGGCGDKVLPPSLFLVGEEDNLIQFYGGKPRITERLQASLLTLVREPIFVPRCGHWIQQEQPQLVNAVLLKFLTTVKSPLVSLSKL
jgi:pimeloyl-ACP methyl ester carboxylesterase